MGACLSSDKLPDNVFMVRNIHDDHRSYPKGIIEVTAVELKYKDAKSGDEWIWPLKFLRKYGCDRDIFSFEAGRKCPGGEGLYAFSTKKASQLFDMVARNISEGGLEGEGALSPSDGNHVASAQPPVSPLPPPVPSPNPPPPPATNPPSHPPAFVQPNYQNLRYENGQPMVAGGVSEDARLPSSSPPPPPPALPNDRRSSNPSRTPTPPPRINYAEVSLPEPSDPSLPLEGKDGEKRVSYTQIDIKQTEEYNRQLAKLQAENAHPLPDLGNAEFKIVTPSERSSRSRMSPRPSLNGTSSSSPLRSMSDSNFATSRPMAQSKGNGSIPGRSYSHSTSTAPDPVLYQNMSISRSGGAQPIPEVPENQQSNYINVTPQPALSRNGSDPSTQVPQTYENLRVGMSPPLSSSSITQTSPFATSPPRLITGDPMGTYADLDLPTTSTPKGRRDTADRDARQLHKDEEHRVALSFSSGSKVTNKTPAPRERAKTSASPQHTEVNLGSALNDASGVSNAPPPSKDDTTVNYTVMNFELMEALRKTKEERDKEIRERTEKEAREEEAREEERKKEELANGGKKDKKLKKQKKKDRRNSHQ